MGTLVRARSPVLSHPVSPDDRSWTAMVGHVFDMLDVSDSTREQYRREVRPFLRFLKSERWQADPLTLLRWKRHLGARSDIGSGTKKKYLIVGRVLLRALHSLYPNLVPESLSKVKGFTVTHVHKRAPITDADVRRVWQHLDEEGDSRTKTILGLLYYQGLRRVELTRLAVDDFERDTQRLFVLGKGRDDGEPVDLHPRMTALLVEYLEEHRLKSGPLFPSPRRSTESLSSNMIWRIVMRVHETLGISTNVHGWRKVFTSKLVESSLNLLEVRQYTRHRNTSQLQVYYDRIDHKRTLPTYYSSFGG